MGRAGAAAAGEIAMRYPAALRRGALVLAGPGNNGGDGWVVARALASAGVDVRVVAPAGVRSADCVAERDMALSFPGVIQSEVGNAYTGEGVVVDALLGTGADGPAHGAITAAREVLEVARKRGAFVVALDLPSGLDATTGDANDAASADTTITFGTIKRGHLVARGTCGTIVVVDIGLAANMGGDDHISLADAAWVASSLPPIDASAHKGTRKKLLLHGGAPGMAGAVILGLRAALRSGIGMTKANVDPACVDAVHGAVPEALVGAWPAADDSTRDDWADVLVLGPGLGRARDTRRAVENAARRHAGPILLDADALTVFEGSLDRLRAVVAGRSVLITPHPGELAQLTGESIETVLARRFEIGVEVARKTGATVLLKGVPTIVSSPDGRRTVVAAGTPTLATGGSGDLLAGIAGTLLAQMSDPRTAAAVAAWIHGRAAELAGPRTRGTTLEDVLEMLPNAWAIDRTPLRYPVIAELPSVGAQ